MSSIQERLQLKRVPLDTWNVREQLCLASAVVRSGDQNWMSVSRALKTIGETNRPPDWYSQKSCAAQYGVLLENVETPKRKKRNSEGAVETPQESILKMLTQQRITEIQNTLNEMNKQYEQLKNEIAEVRNTSTTDERLQELWTGIETAKRARERENARRAAWLKEREERRARAERTWRPPQTTPPSTPSPAPPSSPLLTSLLKSSPVVTTPQHIPHPATIVDAVSPSAGAPTLSLLLEQPHARESKHAAIEHIKSQLVQIEHQLKASSSPQVLAPAVDIDDIEIKAEDVYAFRDIDIHLPPVTTMHKGARAPDKPVLKKEEESVPAPTISETMEEQILLKEEPVQEEAVARDVTADVETAEEPRFEEPEKEPEPEPELEPEPEPEVKISFPEVKFPNPEIKVIQPDDEKMKEEIPVPESSEPVEEEAGAEEEPAPEPEGGAREESPEQVAEPPEQVAEPPEHVAEPPEHVAEPPTELPAPAQSPTPAPVDPGDIPLPPDEPAPDVTDIENIPSPAGPPPRIDDSPGETIEMIQQEMDKEEYRQEERREAEQAAIEEIKKEEDDDSIPLKEMINAAVLPEVKAERLEEDTHTETDDDTPMELSREEEKDGKKKRDYSRKKKSDSRTCSGSESAAEASAPDSPSAGDERQHRLWRKSVMLVYSRLCAHKYASLFLRPISDEEAPGYSVVVKRPMDLTTIRRNIDSGVIRSTAELQRDVLLMLSNALMYNSSSHSVYAMAKEMHEEAQNQLGMLLAAQAHAGLVPPPRRKRRPAPHHVPAKRRHT